MKLAPAEAKAIKFVLLLIVLSAFARWSRRPAPIQVEQGRTPAIEAAALSSAPTARNLRRGLIDPNTASLQELEALPAIGTATARKIIAQRPYANLEDLARVIGRKRAQSLAKRLTLHGPLLAAAPASPAVASVIDLNRASAEELERISGIGPGLAKRLLAARDSQGGFRSWDQVDAVSGVGPALLKKLKAASTL
ncbi:MAG: ComEA family DNA-binding protein [Longimicrobiales bacterium]